MLRGKKGKKYCNYRIDGEHCRYNRRFFRFFLCAASAPISCVVNINMYISSIYCQQMVKQNKFKKAKVVANVWVTKFIK